MLPVRHRLVTAVEFGRTVVRREYKIRSALARAKINLALHVTGHITGPIARVEADGYHALDTLVAFAGLGDRITVEPAKGLSLRVNGPQAAGVPDDESNLVIKAARHLASIANIDDPGASIQIEKHLPPASGIGGGSADAAAAIRLLADIWDIAVDISDIERGIGADVPMCFNGLPARARGIGERLDPVPAIPEMTVVLVNPGIPIPTSLVFQGLVKKNNSPLSDPEWTDSASMIQWLKNTRNDLEAPATKFAPVISDITSALRAQDNCLFARMSGSGATCFGLFEDAEAADRAVRFMHDSNGVSWAASAALDR